MDSVASKDKWDMLFSNTVKKLLIDFFYSLLASLLGPGKNMLTVS